jgi:hypothetical protein
MNINVISMRNRIQEIITFRKMYFYPGPLLTPVILTTLEAEIMKIAVADK